MISLPLTIIEPDSLSSRPPNNINKEDFPEPDGPTSATVSSSNSEKFTDKVISRVPMRRWGEPEDFSGVAVYLASDSSSYHSGDSFVVDGAYAIF